ncbi:unnamed protein product [Cuscuta europaea]|uniref:Uncharacterized protein n=1 Tax=Cuscuta europaea TaxID=41803 RepID=A0A9P0ZTW1_CUSEU|nr:unnamed protein product [Cuscuta europaea]
MNRILPKNISLGSSSIRTTRSSAGPKQDCPVVDQTGTEARAGPDPQLGVSMQIHYRSTASSTCFKFGKCFFLFSFLYFSSNFFSKHVSQFFFFQFFIFLKI